MSFKNIKVGRPNKKATFDKSRDVNTTSNFGCVQPLMCQFMMADSTLTVKAEQLVRLAPMPLPTFGRVYAKTYHVFVPAEEMYLPFNNMLAHKPYSHGDNTYYPEQVPSLPLRSLACFLLKYCYLAFYSGTVLENSSSRDYYQYTVTNDFNYISNPVFLKLDEKLNDVLDGQFTNLRVDLNDPTVLSMGSDITIDNCDFFFQFDSTNFVAARLNNRGLNLYRILKGLGYQINFNDNTRVSILPIFAFYKAYFDLFAPQRFQTWENTVLHKLINRIAIYNQEPEYDEFIEVIDELSLSYYTEPADFVNSHLTTQSNLPEGQDLEFPIGGVDDSLAKIYTDPNKLPYSDDVGILNKVGLDLLTRLTRLVNRNTVIGGRVADYMRSIFNADVDAEESNFIGSYDFPIQISDVMSNSQTTSELGTTLLGEYAGRGIGYNKHDNKFSFHAKKPGFWITLFTIVPKSSYCQGIDLDLLHRTRFEFPTPDFDSIGNELTPRLGVYGISELGFWNLNSQSERTFDDGFGFIPRYMHHKVSPPNILNGQLGTRSTRLNYAGYTLDKKYFDDVTNVVRASGIADQRRIFVPDMDNIIASTDWRYVGRSKAMNSYNLMFYNTGDFGLPTQFRPLDMFMDDNFIIHNILDVKYVAPLLPTQDSYDTDSDSNPIQVQHA